MYSLYLMWLPYTYTISHKVKQSLIKLSISLYTLEYIGTVYRIRPPSGIEHACSPTTSNMNEHLMREEANDIIVTVILIAKPAKSSTNQYTNSRQCILDLVTVFLHMCWFIRPFL